MEKKLDNFFKASDFLFNTLIIMSTKEPSLEDVQNLLKSLRLTKNAVSYLHSRIMQDLNESRRSKSERRTTLKSNSPDLAWTIDKSINEIFLARRKNFLDRIFNGL